MKILITGGCGFLGSNLAADAIAQGIDLCIFDNLYRHGSQNNLSWLRTQGGFDFVHGDIRNSNDVQRVINRFKPDAVFHLAGQVAMTTSIADPRMDFEVNALGTLNVLEAVRTHVPDSAVIYSSSNKVYGDLEQYQYIETNTRYKCVEYPNGFSENTSLDFHSPYGCSKGAADQYLLDYNRIYGLKTVVFRHSSMYGGRQFATADQGWIGWFCQKAIEIKKNRNSKTITISGSGKQVRDVLHASDMKRLYMTALKSIDLAAGQAFNIGGGLSNSLSLLELFDMLEDKLKITIKYDKLPVRESDQRVFIADTTKAKKILDWKPEMPASAGIDDMLNWLNEVN